MITKQGVIEYLTKNSDKLGILVTSDNICDKSGNPVCSIDDYLEILKLKLGCSFKSLYYGHAFLQNVLECNKCGTIIITREDEDYDPNLRCPTCTDYKTYFKYYTKEDIANNKNLQDLINSYINLQKIEDDAHEYERKHGHPYWKLFTKKIYTKKSMYNIDLNCDDGRKSKFKGLYLEISKFLKDKENKGFYIHKQNIIIPLSFHMMYIHWIYPHLGICHKDLRSKWYIGKAIEKCKNKSDKEM